MVASGQPVILVVDDEPLITRNIRLMLSRAFPCEILECQTAFKALELFHARKAEISLVITDYYMPGMSGADLCFEVRKESLDIPVLMLSAAGAEHVQTDVHRVGIDVFMAKPFMIAPFVQLVTKLLQSPPEASEKVRLFTRHFVQHARTLSRGQLACGIATVPFTLSVLEKKQFDPQRLKGMQGIQDAMEEEIAYLEALETVERLKDGQAKRQAAITEWLAKNEDLSQDVVLSKDMAVVDTML